MATSTLITFACRGWDSVLHAIGGGDEGVDSWLGASGGGLRLTSRNLRVFRPISAPSDQFQQRKR